MDYLSLVGLLWAVWLAVMACFAVASLLGKDPSEQATLAAGEAQPFKTREEFLKARMEMDLDQFLGRALVTPREIARATPAKSFGGIKDPVNLKRAIQDDLDKLRSSQIGGSAGQTPPKPYDAFGQPLVNPYPGSLGSGGAGGIVGIGMPFVGGAGGAASSAYGTVPQGTNEIFQVINNVIDKSSKGVSEAVDMKAPEPLSLKKGIWYRILWNGKLALCRDVFLDHGNFMIGPDTIYSCTGAEVEIAAPRRGETWTMKQCDRHNMRVGTTNFMWYIEISPDSLDGWRRSTICGCSVPFEFGHGKI